MRKLLAALLCCLFVLSACQSNGGNQTESGDNGQVAQGNDILTGFNDYYDVQKVEWSDFIGKTEIETDKKYLTEGVGCAKTTFLYTAENSQEGADIILAKNPSVIFRTAVFGANVSDLHDIKTFNIDIFNANDRTIDVLFYVEILGGQSVASSYYTLYPNALNTLSFDTKSQFFGDNTTTRQFVLTFYDQGKYENDNMVLYFDNCFVVKGNKEVATAGTLLSFTSEDSVDSVMTSTLSGKPAISCFYTKENVFDREGCLKAIMRDGIKDVYDVTAETIGYRINLHKSTFKNGTGKGFSTSVYNDSFSDKYVTLNVVTGNVTKTERILAKSKAKTQLKIESEVEFTGVSAIYIGIENWNIISKDVLYFSDIVKLV